MANVKFVLDADEAKAVQGFLKVVDSQRKAERQFDRTTSKIKKQNQAHKKASDSAAKGINRLAGRWLSIGGAIAASSKALAHFNSLNERAANVAKEARFELGQLSQLSGGDPAEMARMVRGAKTTSSGAGMPLPEAGRLQFILESLGIVDQRKMFADLYGSVKDPAALAEGAVTMQTAFTKEETGDVRNIINKGLAASELSKTLLTQLLVSMSQAAPILKEIHATDEESLAAMAVLSKARKSPEQAATELEALAAVMMTQGVSDQGLFSGIGAIRQMIRGKSAKEQLKFFGRKQALKGYQTLVSQGGAVAEAHQAIRESDNQAFGKDRVAGTIRARKGDPTVGPLGLQARRFEQYNIALMDSRAGDELRTQAAVDEQMTLAVQRGEKGLELISKDWSLKGFKYFGAGAKEIEQISEGMDVAGNIKRGARRDAMSQPPTNAPNYAPVSPDYSEREGGPLGRMLVKYLQRIADSNEKVEANTRSTASSSGGSARIPSRNGQVEQ